MLTQVREYYLDTESGERRPGRKGLALAPGEVDELLEAKEEISKAVGAAAAGAGSKAAAAAGGGASKPQAGGIKDWDQV